MKDIHATITQRFIDQLQQGCVPWQRTWTSAMNLVSKKAYRGINSLTLGSAPFGSPFWVTFRQALELGGSVRKGEKSSPIIYYKFLEKRDRSGQPLFTAKGKPAFVPFLRWSNVFNLDQIEGVSAPAPHATPSPTAESSQPLDRAESLVQQANLCPIRQEGFAASYSPTEDLIRMPPRATFRSPEDYYHVLYHEVTHATGHASRLDREGITNPIRFGSERYSKEELIAELGAAFLSNAAGILDQIRFHNSAAYLQSWIRRLKEDPTLIVSAASNAQHSFDWMTGRSPEEQEAVGENLQPESPLVPSFRHEANPRSAHRFRS